jgi:hypothetical protein
MINRAMVTIMHFLAISRGITFRPFGGHKMGGNGEFGRSSTKLNGMSVNLVGVVPNLLEGLTCGENLVD